MGEGYESPLFEGGGGGGRQELVAFGLVNGFYFSDETDGELRDHVAVYVELAGGGGHFGVDAGFDGSADGAFIEVKHRGRRLILGKYRWNFKGRDDDETGEDT